MFFNLSDIKSGYCFGHNKFTLSRCQTRLETKEFSNLRLALIKSSSLVFFSSTGQFGHLHTFILFVSVLGLSRQFECSARFEMFFSLFLITFIHLCFNSIRMMLNWDTPAVSLNLKLLMLTGKADKTYIFNDF